MTTECSKDNKHHCKQGIIGPSHTSKQLKSEDKATSNHNKLNRLLLMKKEKHLPPFYLR